MRRRLAMTAGATAGVGTLAAIAALVISGAPLASANKASVAQMSATPAASVGHPILTPFKHLAGSGSGVRAAPLATPAGSPWTPLVNPPPFGTPGTMLLESDGTVLVHNEPDNNTVAATNQWWKLTPDSNGSYADGTWSQVASMPASYAPLYFGSAVLPDGRMIVEGGEYNGENAVWTNQGAIYDPVTNQWSSVAPPPGWTNIGDAASEVLPNGTFMLQQACNTCTTNPELTVDDALLNAKNLTWTVIPAVGKHDPNDEEGWTLEPSGQLLTVDTWGVGDTELFNPGNDSWIFAGATAANGNPLNPFPIVELGPQAEMPGGNTFVVGGGTATPDEEAPNPCTTNTPAETALYQYAAGTTGTWSAGPEIPTIGNEQYDATDGPASTLPDGNVLFDASACVYNIPTHFFVYNAGSNSLTQIPDAPDAENDTSYQTRMLTLPNGQVLYNDGSNQMEVYTAGGSAKPSWAPSIDSVSDTSLAPGGTYNLSGKQLAGLDQGSAYGDDVQDATNFPLVRITNSSTGVVTYARTHDWSSVSVAPGTSSSTSFTLPTSTPSGKSTLVVIANGIASHPVMVTVS